MRVLVTIPHVFNPAGQGNYGSVSSDPKPRILALNQSIEALHTLYGVGQFYFQYTTGLSTFRANQENCGLIDIIICTTQELHVLDQLPVLPGYYKHHKTHCEPMYLGFECHAVLRDCLGRYDYYCYLEDDLILHDPYFFNKLEWFNSTMGDRAVLQPNRFEVSKTGLLKKVYIDPELKFKTAEGEGLAHYFNDNLILTGMVMGRQVIIKRAENPHAGCFFLNQRQMEQWAAKDYFLDRDVRFFGPLESAASLGIARTFRVYKPAPQNANFLEIQHFGEGWTQKIQHVQFL